MNTRSQSMDESLKKFVSDAIADAMKSSMAGIQKSIDASVQASVQSSLGGVHKSIEVLNQSLSKGTREEGSGSGTKSGRSFGDGGSPGGPPNSGNSNWRFRKLDMPLFDGTNPDGWILRAERYFSFYRLEEEDKLEAAVVALEGDALLWYQWEHRRHPIRAWEDLKMLILRKFRSTQSGSLYEQWLATSQSGSVLEYQRSFIEFSAPLTGVNEEIALGHFINGLKRDIRAELRVMGPRTLDQAMDLALKIEEKLNPTASKSSAPKTSPVSSPFKSIPLSVTSPTLVGKITEGKGGNPRSTTPFGERLAGEESKGPLFSL